MNTSRRRVRRGDDLSGGRSARKRPRRRREDALRLPIEQTRRPDPTHAPCFAYRSEAERARSMSESRFVIFGVGGRSAASIVARSKRASRYDRTSRRPDQQSTVCRQNKSLPGARQYEKGTSWPSIRQ